MNRSAAGIVRRSTGVALAVAVSLGTAAATVPSAAQSTPTAQTAQQTAQLRASTIDLARTIRTTPFKGTVVSMEDHEGSVYVRRDNSLWLSDDEGQRLYELDARTGVLKRMVTAKRLARVHRYRGTKTAGRARTRDLESLSYDARNDVLYAFSGSDCRPSTKTCRFESLPTAFRFTRQGGRLRPQSFQPLPARSQTQASAWQSSTGTLYVGESHVIRSYVFASNSFGPDLELNWPREVFGMVFTNRGRTLYATHGDSTLSRVTWRTRSIDWTIDLAGVGVRDARSVTRIGKKLYVSDGFDRRPDDSPLRYAVFVLRRG
jgi:hypothetical protein